MYSTDNSVQNTGPMLTVGRGAEGNDGAAKPKGMNQLDSEAFMRLFLAQIKHQNPLQPTDSTAILTQMSSMSSISATKDMQDTLHNLEKSIDISLGNTQVLTASQLIGKKVHVPQKAGNAISPLTIKDVPGSTEKIGNLSGSVVVPKASSVTVTIKDSNDNIVKTINLGETSSNGLKDFSWDGKDKDGKLMKADNYKISATATVNGVAQDCDIAGAFDVKSVGVNGSGGVILNLDVLGGVTLDKIAKITG